MRIMHNINSMSLHNTYKKSLEAQSTNLDRIVSGYQIKTSKDNPNGLADAENLRFQVRSLDRASRNMQDGISMLQATEGTLSEVSEILIRMRELVISADGNKTPEEKDIIQIELEELKRNINSNVNASGINGVNPVNIPADKQRPIKMTSGSNGGEYIEIPVYDFRTDKFPADNGTLDEIDAFDMTKSLHIIDESIGKVAEARSKYGSVSNRFENCYNDTKEMILKIEGSASTIADADIAKEMTEYAKNDILVNSGLAMIKQSNDLPMDVLQIIQNIN